MAFFTTFTVFATIAAVVAAAVYFVGIPVEWKRALEARVIQHAGENQAAAMLKDQISKLPEPSAASAEKIQDGIGKMTGGDLDNPLGGLLNKE